eukprot:Tamp_08082.p1 GENE.Tamp_08082~~Tamp_08082.p1  ORF type:complete len:704 (+),score=110.40 Tamp_08082:46-2112(+)
MRAERPRVLGISPALLLVATACAVVYPRAVAGFCWTPGRGPAALDPPRALGALPMASARARRAPIRVSRTSMDASRAAGCPRATDLSAALAPAPASRAAAAASAARVLTHERFLRAISGGMATCFSALLAFAARLAASLVLLLSLALSTPALASMAHAHREPAAHSLLVQSPLASSAAAEAPSASRSPLRHLAGAAHGESRHDLTASAKFSASGAGAQDAGEAGAEQTPLTLAAVGGGWDAVAAGAAGAASESGGDVGPGRLKAAVSRVFSDTKALLSLLGAVLVLPFVVRGLQAVVAAGAAVLANRERVAVKLIQVVAMGPGAERLQERLTELSFKRDELADRMSWAIRNDVSIRDAEKTVVEGSEDFIGEAAVARQAARMMLEARKQGCWVAGKVEIKHWTLADVADAQDSFYARCARARLALDGASVNVADSRPEVLKSSASVRRLREQSRRLREQRDEVQGQMGSAAYRDSELAKRDRLKGPVVTASPRPYDMQVKDKRSVAWDREETQDAAGSGTMQRPPPFPAPPEYEVKARQKIQNRDTVLALYGSDLTELSEQKNSVGGRVEGGKEGEVGGEEIGLDTLVAEEEDAQEKFMVATIVVAVVEKVADGKIDPDAPLESTPQALADLQEASPDNLLSLELIWAPETGNRWLKKGEIVEGLAINNDMGVYSMQRLDLYGNTPLW